MPPTSPDSSANVNPNPNAAADAALIRELQDDPGVLEDAKAWWKSKTIQGAIVILLALILRSAHGGELASEAELQSIFDRVIGLIDLGGTIYGSVLVIIGRATAVQPLK